MSDERAPRRVTATSVMPRARDAYTAPRVTWASTSSTSRRSAPRTAPSAASTSSLASSASGSADAESSPLAATSSPRASSSRAARTSEDIPRRRPGASLGVSALDATIRAGPVRPDGVVGCTSGRTWGAEYRRAPVADLVDRHRRGLPDRGPPAPPERLRRLLGGAARGGSGRSCQPALAVVWRLAAGALGGLLGLEVDEHVGAPQPRADRALELVGHVVSALQRRPVAKLDVKVHVAPVACAPGAQLVKADHLVRPVLGDRVAQGFHLALRQRLVDQHARGAREDAHPG